MSNKNNNDYSTADLALAAVLSLVIPLEAVDKSTDPHRVRFIFVGSKLLKERVSKYWRRELQIEPRSFFDQLRALKARLYE